LWLGALLDWDRVGIGGAGPAQVPGAAGRLKELAGLQRLKSLNLLRTKVSVAGFKDLVKALPRLQVIY
jgi:hypothetical protein